MADIKWIKLSTDLFNNRKIKQIRKLPEGDAIIGIWLQVMCLAGDVNNGGLIYFSKNIPYTDEMLANEFDRPINIVRLALRTFENFGMLYLIDDVLCVSNWEKYQSTEGLEKVKETHRIRQQRYREKQKMLKCDVTVTSPVTSPVTGCSISSSTSISNSLSKELKEGRHKYGDYKNVLLSDADYEKLLDEFPLDYQERIERLSEYMASKGATYKNHLATIRSWSRKDKEKPKRDLLMEIIERGSNEQNGDSEDYEVNPISVQGLLQGQ